MEASRARFPEGWGAPGPLAAAAAAEAAATALAPPESRPLWPPPRASRAALTSGRSYLERQRPSSTPQERQRTFTRT